MLIELSELGHKMKEEMKTTQSEIKQNTQGTNSEGKETRTQINSMEQKEEMNFQPEHNKETRCKKMRRGLGSSGTTLKVPTSESWGCEKEKKKSKKWETNLKK